MDNLKDAELFKTHHPNREEIGEYVKKLLRWIEKDIYIEIAKRVNWLLAHIGSNDLEVPAPGNLVSEDGNWRFKVVGNNFEVQHREGGEWIRKAKWRP